MMLKQLMVDVAVVLIVDDVIVVVVFVVVIVVEMNWTYCHRSYKHSPNHLCHRRNLGLLKCLGLKYRILNHSWMMIETGNKLGGLISL